MTGAISTGTIEKRFICKDGKLTWAKLTVSMQRDGTGRPIHFMAFVEDINARKAAEQELAVALEAMRASELRYHTVFEMSPDFVTISRLTMEASGREQGILRCDGIRTQRSDWAFVTRS